MKIRIQHAHLRDALHRKPIAFRGLADLLGRSAIVDAVGPLLVEGDVGMQPGNAVLGIVADDGGGCLRALLVGREPEAIGKWRSIR